MQRTVATQYALFPDLVVEFPSTRYQGSKAKLAQWIWEQIAGLDFTTCLDAFGGTGAVAFRLKRAGKAVTYNDLLRFNYFFGLAFIEMRFLHCARPASSNDLSTCSIARISISVLQRSIAHLGTKPRGIGLLKSGSASLRMKQIALFLITVRKTAL